MAKLFAVIYRYEGEPALQDTHRPAHLDYLRTLVENGTLVVSGPWGPDDIRGGLLIYAAEGRATVDEIVKNDPFTINGVATDTRVSEWVPLVGPAAEAFTAAQVPVR